MAINLSLVRGDRQSNLDYTDALPVNFTPVVKSIKGDNGYLLANDGLTKFADVNGKARGGYYNERMKMHFRVSGNRLEEIGTDGSVTAIGVIGGNDVCQFASSFNTQAILSGGRLYLYDGATLTEIKSSNLGSPTSIAWFRGIYVLTDGENIYQTDILDEYSISPLKYVTSEFSNDPTIAVRQTQNNQIIAFNRTSIEYFYFNPDAATGVSVLSPVQGKSNKVGIAGVNGVTEMSGVYFCVGSRGSESFKFYMIGSGGSEQVISTRYINQILDDLTLSEIESIYLESRYKDGQHHLIAHLPTHTLIYNHAIASTMGVDNAWSLASTGLDGEVWRAKYGVFDVRVNKWIYGDTKTNTLAELDSSTCSQYGEAQQHTCYTPLVYLDGNIVMQDIDLQSIPGYTTTNTSIFWSFTEDGVSYGQESSYNISTPLKYKSKIRLRNNGMFSDMFGLKFRMISSDKQAFSGLSINFRSRMTP